MTYTSSIPLATGFATGSGLQTSQNSPVSRIPAGDQGAGGVALSHPSPPYNPFSHNFVVTKEDSSQSSEVQ